MLYIYCANMYLFITTTLLTTNNANLICYRYKQYATEDEIKDIRIKLLKTNKVRILCRCLNIKIVPLISTPQYFYPSI